MYRETAFKLITPEQVVLALWEEFEVKFSGAAASIEGFRARLLEAYDPEAHWPVEPNIRSFRRAVSIFASFGFRLEEMMSAVAALQVAGALRPRPRVLPPPRLNPYAEERVESEWAYPAGFSPMPLRRKAVLLKNAFAFLGERDADLVTPPGPCEGMEDMAMVKLSALGKAWKVEDPFGRGYLKIVERLADMVASLHRIGFAKTLLDLKGFSRFEMLPETAAALRRLETLNDGKLAAFPGQMGLRWRGSSARRVIWHCRHGRFVPRIGWEEFPLPIYAVLMELLVQPRRLAAGGLGAYCAGDAVATKSFFGFGRDVIALAFGHDVFQLLDCTGHPDPMFGPATGLAPV